MTQPEIQPERQDFWLTAVRGIVGRCPNCGQGQLFGSYLKPVEHCAACGERFGHIRADDGPAWLTILIVGHMLAPILLNVVPASTWPDWVSLVVWSGFTLVMGLLILPRAKGLFVSLIWRADCVGAEK